LWPAPIALAEETRVNLKLVLTESLLVAGRQQRRVGQF